PDVDGAAYAGLAGWAGALLLAIGVWFGEESAVVTAAVGFAAKVMILATLDGPMEPPVWVQALIVVLIVESAALSMEFRIRPRPMASAAGMAAISAMIAMIVSVGLESMVYGTTGSGWLLRISAVGAVVFLAGWLTVTWRGATD
ncbi:MAG: hypothetical protein R3246_14785, partial [Acidimicrobiia bacterium]|nr:hypothetical protein [Acidimicrobiia bacterium]